MVVADVGVRAVFQQEFCLLHIGPFRVVAFVVTVGRPVQGCPADEVPLVDVSAGLEEEFGHGGIARQMQGRMPGAVGAVGVLAASQG